MLNLLDKVVTNWNEWRRRQRAFAELSALDDRSLADIGISRSEIPYVLLQGEKAPEPSPAPTPAGGKFRHA